jgi:hypothetical protein
MQETGWRDHLSLKNNEYFSGPPNPTTAGFFIFCVLARMRLLDLGMRVQAFVYRRDLVAHFSFVKDSFSARTRLCIA